MKIMTDLPDPALGGSTKAQDPNPRPDDSMPGVTGGISKETETGAKITAEAPPLSEAGPDIDLPKEVTGAGVSIHPTVIPIPAPLTRMGVAPAGSNVPATPAAATTIALPLTDDQIANGLKQNVVSSWRWLAEWCIRKLKQIHKIITNKRISE